MSSSQATRRSTFQLTFSQRSPLPTGSSPAFKLLAPVPPIPDKFIPAPPAKDSDEDDEPLAVTAAAPSDKEVKAADVGGRDQAQATRRKRAAEEAGLAQGEGEKKVKVDEQVDMITLD